MRNDFVYCCVNEDAGYLYLNVPKAACTSIKLAIIQHLGIELKGRFAREMPCVRRGDFALRRTDLFRFAFVRNPFDRLVSFWAHSLQPPLSQQLLVDNPDLKRWVRKPFSYVVREIVQQSTRLMNPHVAPQVSCLRFRDQWLPDQVYHFESLQADWRQLQTRFALPDLPHENKSKHKPYRGMYDEELKALVVERYAKDLETFGYEF